MNWVADSINPKNVHKMELKHLFDFHIKNYMKSEILDKQ